MTEKQVASLYADIGAKTDKFEKGAASVLGGLGKLTLSVGAITSSIELMKDVWDMSVQGAQLERLADSGAEVARQFGGDMDLIVSKVRDASLGTVSEMDIIAASNRAMMLGLGADADKLANLMQVAALRGRAMGVDTTKAFNDIVTGVGRASPMILDNLGIVVNAKETYKTYAESIGKSADELTKAEKTQALLNSVLDEGNKMLEEAGGLTLDNAGKVEQLNSAWKDFTDNRKRESSDLAAGMADDATAAIRGWDELFKAIDSTNEIRKIAGDMARENGGQYQQYFEEARQQWAEQQNAVNEASAALDAHVASLEADAEALKELSAANTDYLDLVGTITDSNQKLADDQEEINQKYADGKITLEERAAALDELAAKQEEASQRMILSMLQEQLAADGLSTTEMQYLLKVGEQWGIYSEKAVADANAAMEKVAELTGALNAIPTQKSIGINVTASGDLDLLRATSSQTYVEAGGKRSHAAGGSFLIPSSYGNEGFKMGNGDTASGGEMVTITPRGGGGDNMASLISAIPSAKANAKALARELMKMGLGQSR